MRTERQSMGCLCPKHVEALGRIASQDEEIARLKARVAHLESRLKIEVRNAREMPFEENTPPSKVNFRKDSDEAARLRTVHWTVGRGFCPRCRKEDALVADILKPCMPRLRRAYLEADVKHADETDWPCNGAHKQYAYGFFTEDVALYRFRKTRAGSVPAAVFGDREPRGVLVTDRYTGYDKPWRGDRQYCFAHILRKLLQLLRKEPDNPEYKAFVPQMAELLAAAMTLRSKGLPPEAFAREAESTRSKIAELAGKSARDPELQKVQNIFREHPDRVYHWARGPDIPAENNRAERGVRGLVIARKTSFGGQSEEALRVREVNQSVMETLALRYDDPAAKLAQALDIYASTGKKSAVRDFLFPKAGRLDCAQHQAQR